MAQSVQIKSVRPWHEQIVDWMLQNPHLTQGQCALFFCKTEAWLSSVINSDLFREYKSRRFTDHQDNVSHSVIERVSGLAGLSLEVLHERIEKEKEDIPLGIVLDSATLMLKSLGYGPKAAPAQASATVNVNLNGASAEVLAQARDNLRKTHVENTIEAEDAEVVGGGDDLIGIALAQAEDQFDLVFDPPDTDVNIDPNVDCNIDRNVDSPKGTYHDRAQPKLPLFGEP